MKNKKYIYRNTDVETIQMLKAIPAKHRPIVARVIWWDWFGSRIVAKRTTLFDHWLNDYKPLEEEPNWRSLAKSLMKMGYPEELALSKMRPKYCARPRPKAPASEKGGE